MNDGMMMGESALFGLAIPRRASRDEQSSVKRRKWVVRSNRRHGTSALGCVDGIGRGIEKGDGASEEEGESAPP